MKFSNYILNKQFTTVPFIAEYGGLLYPPFGYAGISTKSLKEKYKGSISKDDAGFFQLLSLISKYELEGLEKQEQAGHRLNK